MSEFEEYVASLPDESAAAVRRLCSIIREEVPDAGERISYHMPTFTLDGQSLVHVAGWKRHVSIYPLPDGDPELQRDAAAYSSGKGTVRFPLDQPLPEDLVRRIVGALVAARST